MAMPIGPFVNGSAVVIGGLLGAFMGAKLPNVYAPASIRFSASLRSASA